MPPYLYTLAVFLIFYIFFLGWKKKISEKDFTDPTPFVKNKTWRISIIAIGIISIFYFDFVRAFIFENITIKMNYQAHMEECLINGSDCNNLIDYSAPSIRSWFNNLSSMDIYYWKYYAFVVFGIIYSVITQIVLNQLFPKINTLKHHLLFLITTYFMTALLFSLFFYPWETSIKYKWYESSMEISHFIQSSLSCLFLIISFKIYQQIQSEKIN